MGLGDFVKKNISESTSGPLGKAFAGMSVIEIAKSENKMKELVKQAFILSAMKITWPLSLISMIGGVRTGLRSLITDTGALQSALERAARVKLYQGQLEPLLKSAGAAKTRLAELMQFAGKSPFDLGSVVAASRSLEIFTNGAMGGADSLRLMGQIAKSSGVGIEAAADAFGAMTRSLQGGDSVASATAQLQAMGVVSSATARQIAELQSNGASATQVLAELTAATEKTTASNKEHGDSYSGLQKQAAEAKETMKARAGEGFIEAEKAGLKLAITLYENLTPIVGEFADSISAVATRGAHWVEVLTNWVTGLGFVAPAVGMVTKAMVLMLGYFGVTQIITAGAAIAELGSAAIQTAKYIMQGGVAQDIMALRTTICTKALEAQKAEQFLLQSAYIKLDKGLGVAAEGMSGLAGKARGMLAALALNPFVWIAAAAAAAAAVWQLTAANNKLADEMNEMRAATDSASDKLREHTAAIRDQDEALESLAAATKAAADAKDKSDNFDKSHPNPNEKDALNGDELRVAAQKSNHDANALLEGIESGAIGGSPGKKQQQLMEDRAAKEIAYADMTEQNAIQNAHGQKKINLMSASAGVHQAKAMEGRRAQDSRVLYANATSLAASRNSLATGGNKLTESQMQEEYDSMGASGTYGEIIRRESQLRRNQQSANSLPQGSDERKAAEQFNAKDAAEVAAKKQDVEVNAAQHQDAADALNKQLPAEREGLAITNSRAGAENDILQLKTTGMKRARDEWKIKDDQLKEEGEILQSTPSDRRDRAAIDRNLAEQDAHKTEKEISEKAYASTRFHQHSEQSKQQAEVNGDSDAITKIGDQETFASKYDQLRGSGVGKDTARTEAEKFAKNSISLDARNTMLAVNSGTAATDLARIGGGGNVAATSGDPAQIERKRQTDLQQTMVEYLAVIKEGKSGTLQ